MTGPPACRIGRAGCDRLKDILAGRLRRSLRVREARCWPTWCAAMPKDDFVALAYSQAAQGLR
jgi:hypothetical protein